MNTISAMNIVENDNDPELSLLSDVFQESLFENTLTESA